MSEKKNIFESINAVMEEIGAIGKTSQNKQQGFMFRGVDAVMNAINPALIKHKVFIVPEVLEQTREERTTQKGGALIYSICKIKYTFFAVFSVLWSPFRFFAKIVIKNVRKIYFLCENALEKRRKKEYNIYEKVSLLELSKNGFFEKSFVVEREASSNKDQEV